MSGLRIAIDGPSGSGKSTLGRALARRLELPYVDTGAMYRAVAWKVSRSGIDLDRGEAVEGPVAELLRATELAVETDPDGWAIRVDGEEVTGSLRSKEVGEAASFVAAMGAVRSWLLPRQRALAADGCVMEGRDIGTVVLPDADFKFFVTSDEATRVARRAAQLGAEESDGADDDVRARDRRDRSRKNSPLRVAADAVMIDTTDQTVGESLAAMLETIAGA